MRGAALENLTGAIVELCRAGLSPEALRDSALPRLRRAVPFDAVFWATVDPATLLFTRGHQDQIPADTIPYFIHNEFLDDDVNKWTALARDRVGVRTLAEVTAGEMDASPRFRDIFRPLGFGDELRAVLRIQGVCWGYLCLHREAGRAFSPDEVRYVRRIAADLADGIRAGLLISSVDLADVDDAPGLVVVAEDGAVVSMTAAGERWLDELRPTGARSHQLPSEIHALAARLKRPDAADAGLPRLTVRTRSGRWAVLHASHLPAMDTKAVAVIIEAPSPSDLAPLLMRAYGLTPQEQALTTLICRGLSTRELADRLRITPNTVQEHLKAIFDKTGVRSRRELVTAILQQHYLPHTIAGRPLAPSGYFRT